MDGSFIVPRSLPLILALAILALSEPTWAGARNYPKLTPFDRVKKCDKDIDDQMSSATSRLRALKKAKISEDERLAKTKEYLEKRREQVASRAKSQLKAAGTWVAKRETRSHSYYGVRYPVASCVELKKRTPLWTRVKVGRAPANPTKADVDRETEALQYITIKKKRLACDKLPDVSKRKACSNTYIDHDWLDRYPLGKEIGGSR